MPTATEALMGSQTPTFQHSSKAAKVFRDSEKIERFMKGYGQSIQLDPWQRDILYQMLARDKNGMLVHKTCGISVPRQNGKGVIIEARVLFGAIVLKEDIIVTSHHLDTTKSTFARICSYFENPDAPEMADQLKPNGIRRANGQLAIELKNGARISFIARTKSSGRGKTASVLIYDEAQELSKDANSALRPTIASRPDSQVVMLGTPDTGTSDSEVFSKIRETALKKKSKNLFYAEWSADLEDDPADPEVWAKTNPALGRRLSEENVVSEFDGFTERAFMIERLGVWFSNVGQSVIDIAQWGKLVDGQSQPESDLVFAVDVSPARATATIAIAGKRSDGKTHVEFIDHRADGTAWIVPRLKELVEKHNVRSVVIDSKGPIASLEDQISKIRGLRVKKMQYQDVASACGLFYDAVQDGTLVHLSQGALNIAVGGARKRNLGDAWAWSRAHTGHDLTPLIAVTNALWAVQSSKVRKMKTTPNGTAPKKRKLSASSFL